MPLHHAPAKVNLHLTVLARDTSGYHQIETLFCALTLADELDVQVGARGIALDVVGADVGPVERNLVYRAASAYYDAAKLQPAVRIVLHKNIPAGAGLGGGSSDAATTLRALDAMHGYPLGATELLRLGAALGSDVPFFLSGATLALAWGRGDRVLPLPSLPCRPVLVVAPLEPIATADAYGWLAAARAGDARHSAPVVHDVPSLGDWARVAAAAVNELEDVVFARTPALARIRHALRAAGAAPALLSGSGSALFGVFETDAARDTARADVQECAPDARILLTHTAVSRSVAPPSERR